MAGKKTSNRTSTKKVNTKSKNYGLTQNRGKGGKSGRNDAYIENRKKLKEEIAAELDSLSQLPLEQLLENRYQRFRKY